MEPDRNKLQFYTGDPIDKIVAPLVQRTIVNDGNTTGQTGTWQTAKIVQQSYTNPYKKRCFARGRWSIDGGATWNTFSTKLKFGYVIHLTGSFAGPDQDSVGLRAAVSIGVNDDNVIIRTANGYHGNVTVNTDTNAQTYSPISQTFIIEYALYEVE